MRKGTKLEHIAETIRNFTEAGIAVQMMGFTDFPTESFEDAMDSIRFLQKHSDNWTVGGLGAFALTPGAIVAQKPTDFDVENLKIPDGADIGRTLSFQDVSLNAKTVEERGLINDKKRSLARTEFDRPFAGGIDTAHSIFYYSRFGLDFPSRVQEVRRFESSSDEIPVALGGVLIEHEPFNLFQLAGVKELTQIHNSARLEGKMPSASTIREIIERTLNSLGRSALKNPIFIRDDGVAIPCPEEIWEFLRRVDGVQSISELQYALVSSSGITLHPHLLKFMKNSGVLVSSIVKTVGEFRRGTNKVNEAFSLKDWRTAGDSPWG
jgi:hypothetical protein